MTEFDPFRPDDCLVMVDCIRNVLKANRTADGCISPLGAKVIAATVECLEAKLGGPRRGPVGVPRP